MNEPVATHPTRFPRWLKWSLFGALALLIVGYGVIFLYAKVLNDSPEAFGESDLDAALSDDAATGPPPMPATTDSPPGAAPSDGTDPGAAPSASGHVWTVTSESQVGYRVAEVLFGVDAEAVGRTNRITGSITISGTRVVAGEFVVDVASIESDDGRRDNQFRGRIMSTDEFPDATFTLTDPIELGVEPGDGIETTATATGQLTLRGVTNPVTFDLTAEQQNGRIGVLGSIPVTFADYSIANPSFAGITTEDHGLLEFVLVLAPA